MMRLLLKTFAGVTLIVILSLLGAIGYDFISFQPRLKHLLASATPEERSLPPLVAQVFHVAYDDRRIPAQVSRILQQEFNAYSQGGGMLGWYARGALWLALTQFHLSQEEQMTLIAARTYMGKGLYGFSAASESLFHRPLSSLSLSEAATIMAITRAPDAYRKSPERVMRRRDYLIDQVQGRR